MKQTKKIRLEVKRERWQATSAKQTKAGNEIKTGSITQDTANTRYYVMT